MVTVHTPTQSQQGHKILNVCVVLNHASERSQTFKIWQKDADFFEKQNLFNVLEVVNLRPGGLIETPSKSSASRISPQLCQALKAHTPDLLLVYGGDGTNHSVVQSIMAVAPTLTQLGADTPALLLRGGGTGNDFMRNFLKADHSKLARIVRDYEGLDIDVGKITFPETPEQPVYFLNGANIGYAGWITAYMAKPELQGKWQRNYALATLQAIKSCRPRSYKITFHSEEDSSSSVDAKLANIAFMNGQYFGKGIHITPSAQLNDGKMQLAEIRYRRFSNCLWRSYVFFSVVLRKSLP